MTSGAPRDSGGARFLPNFHSSRNPGAYRSQEFKCHIFHRKKKNNKNILRMTGQIFGEHINRCGDWA